MAKCTLLALHCYLSDEGDKDEVFLKFNGKRIWPSGAKYVKADKEEMKIALEMEVNEGDDMNIELWDYDLLTPNDLLGSFNFKLLSKGGPYRTDLQRAKDAKAKYTLEWEFY